MGLLQYCASAKRLRPLSGGKGPADRLQAGPVNFGKWIDAPSLTKGHSAPARTPFVNAN